MVARTKQSQATRSQVLDFKHTFGRRVRDAYVSSEDRQNLLRHQWG